MAAWDLSPIYRALRGPGLDHGRNGAVFACSLSVWFPRVSCGPRARTGVGALAVAALDEKRKGEGESACEGAEGEGETGETGEKDSGYPNRAARP